MLKDMLDNRLIFYVDSSKNYIYGEEECLAIIPVIEYQPLSQIKMLS